jgi:hypothetical protein
MSNVPIWLVRLCSEPDRKAATIEVGRRFVGAATVTDRLALADGWPFGADWPYPNPSRLGCQIGELFSSRDRIVASLVLDHLEGVAGSREHLIALSASYRCCELAGLDAKAVFDEVAAALPAAAAESMRAFLRRGESEREPRAFGLVERTNRDGEVELDLQL